MASILLYSMQLFVISTHVVSLDIIILFPDRLWRKQIRGAVKA